MCCVCICGGDLEVRCQDVERFPGWVRCVGHVTSACHGVDVSELLRRKMPYYAHERGNAAKLCACVVWRL